MLVPVKLCSIDWVVVIVLVVLIIGNRKQQSNICVVLLIVLLAMVAKAAVDLIRNYSGMYTTKYVLYTNIYVPKT